MSSRALDISSYLPTLPDQLRHAVDGRKRDYVAGRLCARSALRCAGHLDNAYLGMSTDGLPLWPPGWVGSISHSGQYAIAVAASSEVRVALGIDIQQQERLETLLEIQTLIANPSELELMRAPDHGEQLLLLFSAKEAIYKALYPQIRRFQDFDSAELVDIGTQSLDFRLTRDWSSRWTQGTRIAARFSFLDDCVVTFVSCADHLSTDHSSGVA